MDDFTCGRAGRAATTPSEWRRNAPLRAVIMGLAPPGWRAASMRRASTPRPMGPRGRRSFRPSPVAVFGARRRSGPPAMARPCWSTACRQRRRWPRRRARRKRRNCSPPPSRPSLRSLQAARAGQAAAVEQRIERQGRVRGPDRGARPAISRIRRRIDGLSGPPPVVLKVRPLRGGVAAKPEPDR